MSNLAAVLGTTDFHNTVFIGCSLHRPALCPSQPNPPKIASRAKNSLSLRWNAPTDNGAAINQYELEWDQCGGEWEQIYCDKAKQFKYSHRFVPGSHAKFRLRASNEVGWRYTCTHTQTDTMST